MSRFMRRVDDVFAPTASEGITESASLIDELVTANASVYLPSSQEISYHHPEITNQPHVSHDINYFPKPVVGEYIYCPNLLFRYQRSKK